MGLEIRLLIAYMKVRVQEVVKGERLQHMGLMIKFLMGSLKIKVQEVMN